jgi:hypothetical protein
MVDLRPWCACHQAPRGDPTVSPVLARYVGNHLTNGDRQDRMGDTSGIAVMNETLHIRPWVVD